MEAAASSRQRPSPRKADYGRAPYIVLWELTRSCALACRHCRAKAIRRRNPEELSLEECCSVLDQLQEFGNPLIVLTGGDPAERDDLLGIISEAKARGFTVAITPSATPRTTRETIVKMGASGIDRLAVSIDGAVPTTHDCFRGVNGSFERSLQICQWAADQNIPLQVNTSITKHNAACFLQMCELVKKIDPVLWSIFFLVPTGRAHQDMQISATECEGIMRQMSSFALQTSRAVKATAAPHFRRVLLESLAQSENHAFRLSRAGQPSSQSINDGKGVVFISHTGDIYPSGFLPLSAGNVKTDSLVAVYRESILFTTLRDANQLKGKCGRCRYKYICGGSRARAFAVCGDYMESDPLCAYVEGSTSTIGMPP